jgi:hypothetical protein
MRREHYEVWRDTVKHGDETNVAKSCAVSSTYVHRWGIPPVHLGGQGSGNPFERVEDAIVVMRRNGNPDADAPFLNLCERLNYLAIPVADITAPTYSEMADVAKEFSDVVRVFGENTADGHETLAEMERFETELGQLITKTSAMREAYRARIDRERNAKLRVIA